MNENAEYAAISFGFDDEWFCSDSSCEHSEDTPEVAFAYFFL